MINNILNFINENKNRLPILFDYQYYLDHNPDLKVNGITTQTDAIYHYLAHGYRENRQYCNSNILFAEINNFNNSIKKQTGVAIVTPDAVGPVKNGGIGTACLQYGLSLVKENIPTSIIYTGSGITDFNTYQTYIRFYLDNFNINFILLPKIQPDYPVYNCYEYSIISMLVSDFLHLHLYKHIVFQDWFGNGFWSIREKKLGRKFLNSHLSVMCHSCTEWQHEGMKMIPNDIQQFDRLRWMEKESISNADTVICTSNHMIDWLTNHNYIKDHNNTVLLRTPYYSTINRKKQRKHRSRQKSIHLAFFGRLEKRKGLDIFIESILCLNKEIFNNIEAISFLGKHSIVDGISSEVLLNKFASTINNKNLKINIHNEMDHEDAINYLLDNNCIVIMPSILDNAPMVVIECLHYGIPILASNSSGIPELMNKQNLFDPNVKSLKNKLVHLLKSNLIIEQKQYNTIEYHEKFIDYIKNTEISRKYNKKYTNNIDVCIPFYNHSNYIENVLIQLIQQTKLPNHIYIINDGSDEKNTKQLYEIVSNIKNQYRISISIIDQNNQGPGHARNQVIKYSQSDYIVFFDSDNIPYSNFIEQLYSSIMYSDYDVIFASFNIIDSQHNIIGKFIPLADYISGAYINNTLGDSCCIAKKSTLEKTPFPENKNVMEDWMWALGLVAAGHKISSIYEPLFSYRKVINSRNDSFVSDNYDQIQYICDIFTNLDDNTKNVILQNFIISAYNQK